MRHTALYFIPTILTIAAVVVISISSHRKPAHTEQHQSQATTNGSIRYLPLGDSYTIGESVAASDRWPNQLAAKLATAGKHMQIVDNPAVTGYTTQDLIDRELPLVQQLKPDFVTVQIGVNDYVQGGDEATFSKNLAYIISSLRQSLPKPQNILLVTIPDYGLTPTGARYGSPQQSHNAILRYNTLIKQAGADNKLPVADIFPDSQAVSNQPDLIANDGLHPSGKQYSLWTTHIFQVMQDNALPQ